MTRIGHRIVNVEAAIYRFDVSDSVLSDCDK